VPRTISIFGGLPFKTRSTTIVLSHVTPLYIAFSRRPNELTSTQRASTTSTAAARSCASVCGAVAEYSGTDKSNVHSNVRNMTGLVRQTSKEFPVPGLAAADSELNGVRYFLDWLGGLALKAAVHCLYALLLAGEFVALVYYGYLWVYVPTSAAPGARDGAGLIFVMLGVLFGAGILWAILASITTSVLQMIFPWWEPPSSDEDI
jgi:hypothetical protein